MINIHILYLEYLPIENKSEMLRFVNRICNRSDLSNNLFQSACLWRMEGGRLPSTLVPRHYSLALTPCLATFTFAGTVTIQLDLAATTDTLLLNVKNLEVDKVVVTREQVEVEEVREQVEVEDLISDSPVDLMANSGSGSDDDGDRNEEKSKSDEKFDENGDEVMPEDQGDNDDEDDAVIECSDDSDAEGGGGVKRKEMDDGEAAGSKAKKQAWREEWDSEEEAVEVQDEEEEYGEEYGVAQVDGADSVTGEEEPWSLVTASKVEVAVERWEVSEEEEVVRVHLSSAVEAGRLTVRVEYRGVMDDSMRGLYRTKHREGWGAATHFEATGARRCCTTAVSPILHFPAPFSQCAPPPPPGCSPAWTSRSSGPPSPCRWTGPRPASPSSPTCPCWRSRAAGSPSTPPPPCPPTWSPSSSATTPPSTPGKGAGDDGRECDGAVAGAGDCRPLLSAPGLCRACPPRCTRPAAPPARGSSPWTWPPGPSTSSRSGSASPTPCPSWTWWPCRTLHRRHGELGPPHLQVLT